MFSVWTAVKKKYHKWKGLKIRNLFIKTWKSSIQISAVLLPARVQFLTERVSSLHVLKGTTETVSLLDLFLKATDLIH